MTGLDLLNRFKDSVPDDNLYEDIKVAWVEYEYICSIVKTSILEIINNDLDTLIDNDIKDEGFVEVEIQDATVIIIVKPAILTSTLNKIESLLGVEGKVLVSGTKKNAKMKIIFENNSIDTIDCE